MKGAPPCARTARFTLTELMASSAITVLLLASILPIAISLIKASYVTGVKMDLREQVNTARGWLMNDLRRTAKDVILTYPTDGIGNLTAVSLLTYERTSNTEVPIDISVTPAKIKWNREIIYLIKQMPDGTCELRRSTFSYDYQNTTAATRQARLSNIVANGTPSASSALLGTRAIMKGITNYSFTLGNNILIDGYSAVVTKKTVTIGTAIFSPSQNPHTVSFLTRGKNSASSGYRIGVDSLIISQAGLPLEAESAAVASASPSVTCSSPSSGVGWSNHQILEFPATGAGSQFTLSFGYETWEDSNFNIGSFTMHNARGNLLDSGGVLDQVLQMGGTPVASASDPFYGYSISWQAVPVSGGNSTNIQNSTVRTLVPGGSLLYCGRQAKIKFSGPPSIFEHSHPLAITSAYIMPRSGTSGFVGTGTPVQLFFGGSAGVTLNHGVSVCCDVVAPAGWGFDESLDYLVSFAVADNADLSYGPWYSLNTSSDSLAMTSLLAGSSYVNQTSWPSSGTGQYYDSVGVSAVGVSYPDGTAIPSTYTSQIIDTKKLTSSYGNAKGRWATASSAGSVTLQARSGATADLSDLGGAENGWSSPCSVSGGSIGLGSGRYIQLRVNLFCTSPYLTTPVVKNVKLTWDGEANRMSQVSAEIACGPNRGVFEAQIDGLSTANPLIMLMNFTTARTFMGKTYTDSFAVNIKPQNKTPQ